MSKSILPNNEFEWYWFWRGSIACAAVLLTLLIVALLLGVFR